MVVILVHIEAYRFGSSIVRGKGSIRLTLKIVVYAAVNRISWIRLLLTVPMVKRSTSTETSVA
jgi:hypothetical protein